MHLQCQNTRVYVSSKWLNGVYMHGPNIKWFLKFSNYKKKNWYALGENCKGIRLYTPGALFWLMLFNFVRDFFLIR